MKDRDMYYGYGGLTPINNGNFPPFPNQNTYIPNQFNDINERLNRLERQIKRLDQRLTRIETPYINNKNNEPDNNMYMM